MDAQVADGWKHRWWIGGRSCIASKSQSFGSNVRAPVGLDVRKPYLLFLLQGAVRLFNTISEFLTRCFLLRRTRAETTLLGRQARLCPSVEWEVSACGLPHGTITFTLFTE